MYTHIALEILEPRADYIQFAELTFYQGTSDISSGGTPYASSEFWTWLAALAFDGVESTQSSSEQPLPQGRLLIGTALAAPIAGFESYRVVARDKYPDGIPRAWRVGLSTGTRLARDPFDYDWVETRRDIPAFTASESRIFYSTHATVSTSFIAQITASATTSQTAPVYIANITAGLLGITGAATGTLTLPNGQTGQSVSGLGIGMTATGAGRSQLKRYDVCEVTVRKRSEGGAVQITFTLPEGYPKATITRYVAGTLQQPTTVLNGTPQPGGRYLFGYNKHGATDPTRRGMAWDLQAYVDRFGEEPNALDGHTFDYWITPQTADGKAGDPVVVTNVSPRRSVNAEMDIDLKTLLYHRLRYHAAFFAESNVFVGRQDHINGSKGLPQVLFKVRHVLTERPIGRRDAGETIETYTMTYRGIVDIMVVCDDPGQRDRLGDHMRLHLLSDFGLLESLDYVGLNLNDQDGHINLAEINYYTRELSLEGMLEATVNKEKDVTVKPIVVYPFVPYPCQ